MEVRDGDVAQLTWRANVAAEYAILTSEADPTQDSAGDAVLTRGSEVAGVATATLLPASRLFSGKNLVAIVIFPPSEQPVRAQVEITREAARQDMDGDGFSVAQGDCNDFNPYIHPGAMEIPYNDVDDDCDPRTPDDDLDHDGYGHAVDCNDNDPAVHPGAPDRCGDGIDQDCQGGDPPCSADDRDHDGYSSAQGDCNDADPTVHPGAAEIPYNGKDDDCDAATPDDDLDRDGYLHQVDCNDHDAAVHPGAIDRCGDGIDQDCVGGDAVCPPSDEVSVPAGPFLMGSLPGAGETDELPQHTVTISGFSIDRTEVTNAAYGGCVSAGVCTPPGALSSDSHPSYFGDAQFASFPVIYVSWMQADAYCRWLGKRLPTEAEWEKTARGAQDGRQFPWGDTPPTCMEANLKPLGHTCVGDTQRVGSYPLSTASPYGALDMCGNVWEWVADWYADGYYATSPASDPAGPASGAQRARRGGAWVTDVPASRVANRASEDPTKQLETVGFRCAHN